MNTRWHFCLLLLLSVIVRVIVYGINLSTDVTVIEPSLKNSLVIIMAPWMIVQIVAPKMIIKLSPMVYSALTATLVAVSENWSALPESGSQLLVVSLIVITYAALFFCVFKLVSMMGRARVLEQEEHHAEQNP